MPIRKLVELDEDGWCKEIDSVKLKRVADEFKAWLLTVDRNNDPFRFLDEDLPLVDAALSGSLKLPFKGSNPHSWENREGLLPREYTKISAPFYVTIRGAERSIDTVIRDSKRYAWVNFESPSDFNESNNGDSQIS